MTELKPWNEIFGVTQLYHYVRVQDMMMKWICTLTPKGGNILEVGFGTGWTTMLLAQLGYHVEGIDIDPENVESAINLKEALLSTNQLEPRFYPLFEHKDLWDLYQLIVCDDTTKKTYDVVFSDGVAEHWDDVKVIEGIRMMKDIADHVIIDVPSWNQRNTKVKHGDEIYRKNKEWVKLIKRASFKVKEIYGSMHSCPQWWRIWIPYRIGKHYAHWFSSKVGFVI